MPGCVPDDTLSVPDRAAGGGSQAPVRAAAHDSADTPGPGNHRRLVRLPAAVRAARRSPRSGVAPPIRARIRCARSPGRRALCFVS